MELLNRFWQASFEPLGRFPYFIIGLVCVAVKFPLDILFASFFGRQWHFIDYYYTGSTAVFDLEPAVLAFYVLFVLWSLPFIVLGTFLCLRRLADTGLPRWIVLFFFIPGLNFAMFVVLSLIPGKVFSAEFLRDRTATTTVQSAAVVAIAKTVLVSLVAVAVLTFLLGQYGWGLFLGVPFFLGYGTVYGIGRHSLPSRGDAFKYSAIAVAIIGILMFFLNMEGLICILMTAPMALLLAWVGALFALTSNQMTNRYGIWLLAACFAGFIAWENSYQEKELPTLNVTSHILIKAPPGEVWSKLIAFPPIAEPGWNSDDILFKIGIAYPTAAEIVTENGQQIRYCKFNTGAFKEPITVWKENEHLAFTVSDQPDPMRELSPYPNLEVPHLKDYFRTTRGEFRLEQVEQDGKIFTKVSGTTWYKLKFWPQFYWETWAENIISRIHGRVLRHLARVSETGTQG